MLQREVEDITELEKVNTDNILIILHRQLNFYLSIRVENVTKHNHFFIQWFRSNFPIFCAIVTLVKYRGEFF